ncbi:methyltransferase [Krasilnikovia sp. M28-CT-15]|uniref:methyltransferase n=1 Tax=Krasilnikovia sp. M28-CT-15 TaxID=3373540 RepID=UPI003875EB7F
MSARMRQGPRRLDLAVRDALTRAHVDGTRVRLADQLTPADYTAVAKVLAALGGLWSPAARATVFPDNADPADLIVQVLRSGVVPWHPRTAEGWVRTPDDLADELCAYPHTDLAWLPAGSRVLEPSAGIGSLAAAMLRTNPGLIIDAVEPNPQRAAVCRSLGDQVTVHQSTFETYAAQAMRAGTTYSAIVMNPPFAVPSDPAIWQEHVRMAWHLLAPGARLVCVVPATMAHRGDARHRDIRTFIEHHGLHYRLPPDAFAESGTGTATAVVTLTKPVRRDRLDFLFPDQCALASAFAGQVPVRVEEPRLTGEAAKSAPVQVWWDSWRRRDRTLRYRGRCVLDGWLLWGFDDGENDPRGVLGDFTAGFSLHAEDYDLEGPSVGLCCGCGNDGDRYRAGLDRARGHWSTPVSIPEPDLARPGEFPAVA